MFRASRKVLAVGIILLATAATVGDAGAQATEPDFRAQVERIIREYLGENPEVVVEALRAFQDRQRQAERQRQTQSLDARADEMFSDPDAPVAGNVNGNVTIVEFFDYQCGYCKRVHPIVKNLVADDGNIRFIYKEFPILGPESVFAARAALAARWQGKYGEFHDALMRSKGRLPEERVFSIAASVGLDPTVLRHDMETRRFELDVIIERNLDLAKALDITGTPGFVVEDAVVQGAMDKDSFVNLVGSVRANKIRKPQ